MGVSTPARLPLPTLAAAALAALLAGSAGAAPAAGQAGGIGPERRAPASASIAPRRSRGDVDEAWERLETWLRGRLENEGIVGGSVYLVRGGEVVGRLHHGIADIASRRPVDERTIFHWASITKTFTAVAFMQLRDRGLVALDDPVLDRIHELREVHDPYGSVEEITYRHLLSHSAGFRAATWPWGGDEAWHPDEPTRWEQLAAMMPYTEIRFPPGSRYSYSNPGIIFVGKTIERIAGEPYELYVQKNLFSPLGMASAYFDRTPYHLQEHRSNNYVVVNGVPRPNGLEFDTGITASNGGLNASVPDMVRWLGFLTGHAPSAPALAPETGKNGRRSSGTEGAGRRSGTDGAGRGPADGAAPGIRSPGARAARPGAERVRRHEVLSRSTLREMFEPVVPVNRAEGSKEWMGLGFFVYERAGRRYVGHTGSQKAFRSFFYIDPETGAGAVGVFNTVAGEGSFRPDTEELRVELREKLLDEIFPLFAR